MQTGWKEQEQACSEGSMRGGGSMVGEGGKAALERVGQRFAVRKRWKGR